MNNNLSKCLIGSCDKRVRTRRQVYCEIHRRRLRLYGDPLASGDKGKGRRKHGADFQSPEYRTWTWMRSRCYCATTRVYAFYGGRGITVCERWDDFANFLADMGPRPSKEHSLDRIDSNGNYEPSNCRWATRKEQNNNRRDNNRVLINGESLTVAELADRTGLSRQCLYDRINRNWKPEDLSQPSRRASHG